MNTQKKTRFSKFGMYSIILTLVFLLILIAVNFLVSLLPSGIKRIDTTSLGLTELSDVTKDYLKKLDGEITIAHICIYGEEDATVSDLLAKYGESSSNVKIKQVDPAVDPSFTVKYTADTLENNSVIIIGEKRSKVIDYNDLFTFALYYAESNGNNVLQGEMSYSDFMTFYNYYSSYFGTYYSYDTLFAGENAITSAIDYVTSDTLPTFYTLTGHGEASLPESLVKDLGHDNIDVKELSLITSSIPDDCSGIIIYSPYSDISAAEYQTLKDYISASGKIILLTDKENLDLPNLMTLMSDYGLHAEQTYICESTLYIGQIYMLVADSGGASSLLRINGYNAVMPLAHPIIIGDKSSDSGIAYIELFKTSENAYTVGEFTDGENEGYDDSNKQVYTTGVLASVDNGEGTSHILWISSPGFISDEVNNYSVGGNYVYFLSLMEKLTNKSSSLALASKTMVEESLIMTAPQSYFWTVVVCALIPGAFFAAGIITVVRRKRR